MRRIFIPSSNSLSLSRSYFFTNSSNFYAFATASNASLARGALEIISRYPCDVDAKLKSH